MTIASGRITCLQCHARSKRTGEQCKAPAMKGKKVCKSHGGRSTGPRTEAGRARCAAAKSIHGSSTRQARTELSAELVQLARLEDLGRAVGLITGPRSPGRRPGHRKD